MRNHFLRLFKELRSIMLVILLTFSYSLVWRKLSSNKVCSRTFRIELSFEIDAMSSKHQDFEWAFGLNRLSLKAIGIWPDEVTQTISGPKIFRVPFMVLAMLTWIFLPVNFALFKVVGELPLVIDNLTVETTTLIAMTKLFLLWSSRKILQPVIEMIQSDWSDSIKIPWQHEIMVKQARRARIFTMSGYMIMFGSFLGFLIMPLFGVTIRIINNRTDVHEGYFLPLQSCYPFDYGRSPVFELVYVAQVVASIFIGISMSVPDNFFGGLVFHACARCEILQKNTRSFLDNEDVGKLDHGKFKKNLRDIVETHQRVIRFIDAVEDSFNLLILAQVVCLSFNLCCLGFGVIKSFVSEEESRSLVQIITLGGTLLNLMIHMFVYCIASEILLDQNSRFSEALYSSYWYLLSPKHRKDIIPIMVRSQRPLQLTAGKFLDLSLNTYMKIVKTTVGYISVLLAIYQ